MLRYTCKWIYKLPLNAPQEPRKSLGGLEELRERLNKHGTPLENILGPPIRGPSGAIFRYRRYLAAGSINLDTHSAGRTRATHQC